DGTGGVRGLLGLCRPRHRSQRARGGDRDRGTGKHPPENHPSLRWHHHRSLQTRSRWSGKPRAGWHGGPGSASIQDFELVDVVTTSPRGTGEFRSEVSTMFGHRERVRRGGYPTRQAAKAAWDELLERSRAERTTRTWTVARWLRYWLTTRTSIRPSRPRVRW